MKWIVSGEHLFYISVFSIVKLLFTPVVYQLPILKTFYHVTGKFTYILPQPVALGLVIYDILTNNNHELTYN